MVITYIPYTHTHSFRHKKPFRGAKYNDIIICCIKCAKIKAKKVPDEGCTNLKTKLTCLVQKIYDVIPMKFNISAFRNYT